ncbi:MAG TPA: site-specific integrase [Gammaproteobacteria bacterium]|nr:MAG: integrase [Gammaproteobacteria bacterium RIFCSPHIGHO2_12_FULL_41_20]HLB42451.1 site-specific integrase [Gammaproteobacteria bacterium]
MTSNATLPTPLFDTLENIENTNIFSSITDNQLQDYQQTTAFLKSYKGSIGTFNAYRREVERLLHWSWLVANKSIKELRRLDIDSYLSFCQSPPHEWIGIKKAPRFIDKNGERIPNLEWRPFVVTVSKSAFRHGLKPDIKDYALSSTAIKDIFAILGSFYNFLIQEDYTEINPILYIRQKSKYISRQQGKPRIRRLSELQWEYVIETAELMAKRNKKHHRTLFIMTALYAMYLRISELAASERWTPKMCDFYRDHDGLWWFTTIGKGNKARQISVSDAMLAALKRYRKAMDLSPLPSPTDKSPLLPRNKGKGPIISTTYIRKIVQQCFDKAIIRLQEDGFNEDADALLEATVHWLRHTGISEDVKRRPREHVRDDAGHGSGTTTDKYIDVELRERHASARKKPIK